MRPWNRYCYMHLQRRGTGVQNKCAVSSDRWERHSFYLIAETEGHGGPSPFEVDLEEGIGFLPNEQREGKFPGRRNHQSKVTEAQWRMCHLENRRYFGVPGKTVWSEMAFSAYFLRIIWIDPMRSHSITPVPSPNYIQNSRPHLLRTPETCPFSNQGLSLPTELFLLWSSCLRYSTFLQQS